MDRNFSIAQKEQYAAAETEEQLEAMIERDAATLIQRKKLDRIEGFNGYF